MSTEPLTSPTPPAPPAAVAGFHVLRAAAKPEADHIVVYGHSSPF